MRDLEPIDGGFHVRDCDGGHRCIDVLRMVYNWRVVRSDRAHQGIDAAFCYFGHSGTSMEQAFVNAVLAAQAWDGVGEPAGYDKRAL